ncbi:MAG: hypothetical protein D6692_02320 [Planctomycetota bacterium]|nr:MAG: hypothetical protein D6692_02320 [Planctomycetota bacterium]
MYTKLRTDAVHAVQILNAEGAEVTQRARRGGRSFEREEREGFEAVVVGLGVDASCGMEVEVG